VNIPIKKEIEIGLKSEKEIEIGLKIEKEIEIATKTQRNTTGHRRCKRRGRDSQAI
jgi:hypothetical protein